MGHSYICYQFVVNKPNTCNNYFGCVLAKLRPDWTLDWTDQNSCIQTANATKATTACPQLCLKLLPCRGVLGAASSRFPRGQRSRTYFNKLQRRWLGWLLVGSVNGLERPWPVSTVSYGDHMHLLGQATSSIFEW